jgi:hypothetical protein
MFFHLNERQHIKGCIFFNYFNHCTTLQDPILEDTKTCSCAHQVGINDGMELKRRNEG